jgi:hypothetical protein
MTRIADRPVIIPDRKLDEERKPGRTSAHPLSALRLVTAQRGQMVLHLRT